MASPPAQHLDDLYPDCIDRIAATLARGEHPIVAVDEEHVRLVQANECLETCPRWGDGATRMLSALLVGIWLGQTWRAELR